MYFLLILFFASLLCIVFMIGRKLVLLQNGRAQILSREENFLKVEHIEKLKRSAVATSKAVGHTLLVGTIRGSIRSSNFLKQKSREAITTIRNKTKKGHIQEEKQEISKFLKIISDYKHKIREIKHKIKEEEKSL